MQDRKGAPAALEVLRKGQTMLLNITPELTDEGGTKVYLLGFHPVPPPVKVEKLSFAKSLGKSWDFSVKNSMLIKDVVEGDVRGPRLCAQPFGADRHRASGA